MSASSDLRPAAGLRSQSPLRAEALRTSAARQREKIVSNILRHGCRDGRRHRIGVELAIEAGVLRVEVTDDARPFNVLAIADPPPSLLQAPLGKRLPGGLGIYPIKQLVERLDYRRHDGLNHVVLETRLPSGATESDERAWTLRKRRS